VLRSSSTYSGLTDHLHFAARSSRLPDYYYYHYYYYYRLLRSRVVNVTATFAASAIREHPRRRDPSLWILFLLPSFLRRVVRIYCPRQCRNTFVSTFLRIPGWPLDVATCIVLFPFRRARTSFGSSSGHEAISDDRARARDRRERNNAECFSPPLKGPSLLRSLTLTGALPESTPMGCTRGEGWYAREDDDGPSDSSVASRGTPFVFHLLPL